MEISYIAGLSVKPLEVSETGLVTFTNGMLDAESLPIPITPNQRECEAYGYSYNEFTGTCSAFAFNTNLNQNFNNIKNKIYGAGNTTDAIGINNTLIMGENNTAGQSTRNNIITGSNNEISNNVNNVNVLGTKGQATADNSLVIGGNAGADNLGERQSIHLMYGLQTTDGSNTSSFLNNTTDSLFAIPANTIMYFHADVVAVRVGGTADGSVGDYGSWVERGVIINKSGVLSINRERDVIKNSGAVSGWQPTGIVSGTNFAMRVRGAADMTIEWCSNITFTQIKTGVTL